MAMILGSLVGNMCEREMLRPKTTRRCDKELYKDNKNVDNEKGTQE